MDLFSKNEEKDGPGLQNKRKKWTCSAKIKKMDLFSKMKQKKKQGTFIKYEG